MSDQQQCPECGGEGARPSWLGRVACSACGPDKVSPEKLVGPVGEPSELVSNPDELSDRCPECLSTDRAELSHGCFAVPDSWHEGEADSWPGLPADLIDQAAELARSAVADLYADDAGPVPDDELEIQIRAVARLFIEHGRQQEKTRWETRIEMKAAERDAAVASQTRQANLASEQGRYRGAADSKDSADWFESQAQLLRSLLNEEAVQ